MNFVPDPAGHLLGNDSGNGLALIRRQAIT